MCAAWRTSLIATEMEKASNTMDRPRTMNAMVASPISCGWVKRSYAS